MDQCISPKRTRCIKIIRIVVPGLRTVQAVFNYDFKTYNSVTN